MQPQLKQKQQCQFRVALCTFFIVILIIVNVTLLCPGLAAAASPSRHQEEEYQEPLIDQIAMEAIDGYSPPQINAPIQAPPSRPATSRPYSGFKINPNCKCGISPYIAEDRDEGNPHPWTAAIFYRSPSTSTSSPFLSSSGRSADTTSSMLLFCTGSLINDRYVITASRCVHGLNATDLQVWLSEKAMWSDQQAALRRSGQRQYQRNTNLKKCSVDKVIIHPDFNTSTLNHEIALLRLSEPLKLFSGGRRRGEDESHEDDTKREQSFATAPVCLPKEDLIGENEGSGQDSFIKNMDGIVVSWDKKGRTSYSLVQTIVPFVNGIEKCAEMTNKSAVLNDNMICAGQVDKFASDSCSMDTGSPLLFYENGSTPHRNPINQDRVRERTGSSKSGVSDWRSNHNSKGHHTLVGVSSWLYGCTDLANVNVLYDVIFPNNTAKPQIPGVYSKIERYRDWITHNTLDAVWCA